MSKHTSITRQELQDDVAHKSGKSTGWPKTFIYEIKGNSILISADNKVLDKKAIRRLDPWGLAFLIEAEHQCGIKIDSINFAISGKIEEIKPDGRLIPDLEAFRRRVSFLSINNPSLSFTVTINGESLELDDINGLFARPDNEMIHKESTREAQDNQPGRLEKDFQTWLSANDVKGILEKDAKTNVRLAVLGEDFFKLGKRNLGIIREFPTGVFDKNISPKPTNRSRILSTEFVDIVTVNKYGQLAIVELKLNDSQLEVIAQLLDYSLFFRCYRDRLWNVFTKNLRTTTKNTDIICYVVNNYFHKRFDDLLRFYSPKSESYGFRIRKTLLGHYPDTSSHAALP